MKSWTPPTNEMIEKVLSSVKKETDRQYFFSRLKNPLWIEPLHKRGYFDTPPGVNQLPDGYVHYPNWPELSYLVNVAKEASDQIIEIVLGLAKTDNPRVYDEILSIALRLQGSDSARLCPKLIEYTDIGNQFLAFRYPELLQHWISQGNIGESLKITKNLVQFNRDPKEDEKRKLRDENPEAWETTLEPVPRLDQWEYQQVLEKGVRPLAEKEPYQVARILTDAAASMIRMRVHLEEFEKGLDEDYSEIWCRRLDQPDRDDYQSPKETLIFTLTYACEKVYDKAPESVDALDQALRNQRWKLFKRLRQHLYATHPNDQTLPWIREFILGHNDYSRWEYDYEFQLMIRKAAEYFGPRLLGENEQSAIFEAILSGPSKENFREWMGERYSDEAFQQRRRFFHRMQLRPFATLLSGETRQYLDELEAEEQAKVVTDDSYSPQKIQTGWVTHRSPISVEDLEQFADEELLRYLNDWDDERRDGSNLLIEINISALAGVFQSLFKEGIIPDGKRLSFWMEHRDEIARPIYVVSMVNAMEELVKEKDFSNLDQWIEFCSWVLSHSDPERVEGQPEPRDESCDHPDWGSSRRAVVDFIDTCVGKDTDGPLTAREGLADLLRHVCNQFDWRLDRNRPVLLNWDDPVTEAINRTRGRALQSVVNFGFWVRRHLPEGPVAEVTGILSTRMAGDAEFPLTRPEHALLGMQFGNLYALDRDWAIDQQGVLFPQENEPVWGVAFGSYILFNRPFKVTFEILREDYKFALENLDILVAVKNDEKELIDRLGQHLFSYYLWEVFPLKGPESLLERFYDKTSDDPDRWARLFDHVGRSLRNSGKNLDKALIDRAVAYFNWRLDTEEVQELQEFTFWLEAECLESEWRLQSYAKILGLEPKKKMGLSMNMKTLHKLLPDNLALVVECLERITNTLDKDTQMYVFAEETRPILKAGLNAEDPQVRENAERAREKLLQLGRFDFLDMK